MAFQALRATKELVAGTYQAGAPGSDVAQIRLTGDNAFPGRKEPMPWVLRDVAGSNRPVQTGAGQFSTKGSFNTPFYFSQAKVLLPWACTISRNLASPTPERSPSAAICRPSSPDAASAPRCSISPATPREMERS